MTVKGCRVMIFECVIKDLMNEESKIILFKKENI